MPASPSHAFPPPPSLSPRLAASVPTTTAMHGAIPSASLLAPAVAAVAAVALRQRTPSTSSDACSGAVGSPPPHAPSALSTPIPIPLPLPSASATSASLGPPLLAGASMGASAGAFGGGGARASPRHRGLPGPPLLPTPVSTLATPRLAPVADTVQVPTPLLARGRAALREEGTTAAGGDAPAVDTGEALSVGPPAVGAPAAAVPVAGLGAISCPVTPGGRASAGGTGDTTPIVPFAAAPTAPPAIPTLSPQPLSPSHSLGKSTSVATMTTSSASALPCLATSSSAGTFGTAGASGGALALPAATTLTTGGAGGSSRTSAAVPPMTAPLPRHRLTPLRDPAASQHCAFGPSSTPSVLLAPPAAASPTTPGAETSLTGSPLGAARSSGSGNQRRLSTGRLDGSTATATATAAASEVVTGAATAAGTEAADLPERPVPALAEPGSGSREWALDQRLMPPPPVPTAYAGAPAFPACSEAEGSAKATGPPPAPSLPPPSSSSSTLGGTGPQASLPAASPIATLPPLQGHIITPVSASVPATPHAAPGQVATGPVAVASTSLFGLQPSQLPVPTAVMPPPPPPGRVAAAAQQSSGESSSDESASHAAQCTKQPATGATAQPRRHGHHRHSHTHHEYSGSGDTGSAAPASASGAATGEVQLAPAGAVIEAGHAKNVYLAPLGPVLTAAVMRSQPFLEQLSPTAARPGSSTATMAAAGGVSPISPFSHTALAAGQPRRLDVAPATPSATAEGSALPLPRTRARACTVASPLEARLSLAVGGAAAQRGRYGESPSIVAAVAAAANAAMASPESEAQGLQLSAVFSPTHLAAISALAEGRSTTLPAGGGDFLVVTRVGDASTAGGSGSGPAVWRDSLGHRFTVRPWTPADGLTTTPAVGSRRPSMAASAEAASQVRRELTLTATGHGHAGPKPPAPLSRLAVSTVIASSTDGGSPVSEARSSGGGSGVAGVPAGGGEDATATNTADASMTAVRPDEDTAPAAATTGSDSGGRIYVAMPSAQPTHGRTGSGGGLRERRSSAAPSPRRGVPTACTSGVGVSERGGGGGGGASGGSLGNDQPNGPGSQPIEKPRCCQRPCIVM